MTTFTVPVFVFVLSIMTFGAEIGVCQDPCPHGWICFNGRCFRHIAEKKTWLEAEQNCLRLGGNLASEHSQDEHEFLKRLHMDQVHSNDPFWIGLTDSHKENVWLWSDGTNPSDFSKWNPSEPNNSGGNEGCVHSNWRVIPTGEKDWNDIPCDAKYASICVLRVNC